MKRWAIRVLVALIIAPLLFISGARGVDVRTEGNYLSISVKTYDLTAQAAASITKLGTNNQYKGVTEWTALSSLSISADDHVIVCEAGDAATSAVNLVKDGTIKDSFSTYYDQFAAYANYWHCQSFTTTSGYDVVAIGINILKTGTPSGNLNVYIYLEDGSDEPTGSILTSGSVVANNLSSGWNIVSLTSYSLSNSTKYCIVVSVPDGDVDNCIELQGSVYSDYAGGKGATSSDSGSTWTPSDTDDWNFRTYSVIPIDISLDADVTANNARNVVGKIWSGQASATGTAWYIVITNADDAVAMVAYKVSGLESSPLDKIASDTGSGDNPLSGTTATLTQSSEVGFAVIFMEEEIDEKGTWVNDSDHVYDASYDQDACADGGKAKSITVCASAEVLSATTAQKSEQTSTGGNDWGAVVATYKVSTGTPDISNTPSTWTLNGITGNSTINPDTVYYSNPNGDTTPPNSTVANGDCRFTVTNDGSAAVDLVVDCSNFSGGSANMANSGTGSNGATSYGGYAWYSGMTYSSKVVMKTTGSDTLYSNLAASATLKWGAEIETQTDSFGGGSSSSATLTITATLH